ncbi:hypothetical protein QQ045_013511 [Rhodiola kirilowii]
MALATNLIFILILSSISHLALIQAQQPYVGKLTTDCNNLDNSSSSLGYTCNGVSPSCQSYLVFRSLPPYNSVASISKLLGADPAGLAQINNVQESAAFSTNKLVIVPVTCSCSGAYYQKNTTYLVTPGDIYLSIANNTFQALTTCQTLQAQNNVSARELIGGTTIRVPLRCACPTAIQQRSGVKYLLTYLIAMGDDTSAISARFGANDSLTREANELNGENALIYFFTTLLVPLTRAPNVTQTDTSPLSPPPPPPPPAVTSPGGKSNLTWVYIVVGVVVVVGILVAVGIFVCCKRKRKRSDKDAESESFELFDKPSNKKSEKFDDVSQSLDFMESLASISQSLKMYTYKELQAGTNGFSSDCLIKGNVYRGNFNGDYAAIKKMSGDVTKEINILNKINHLNLIRLSGFCFNKGDSYLIYEYAINGPLSDWIYGDASDDKYLTWTQRVQIALDVATGLNYLHSYTTPPHVHQDIKCNNVFLDSDFRAKIAHFDMVRLAEGEDGQFVLTRHIVGTKGYMSPEYLENGLISTKLDVYAFGILLLEILTGKEIDALYTKERKALTDILKPLLHEENKVESLKDFIDPALGDDYPLELAMLVAHLIDRCAKHNPSSRPGMDEVVTSLSRILNSSLTWDFSNNSSEYHSVSL